LANIVPRPLSARSSSVKPPPVSSPSRSSPPSSPYPQLRGVLLKKHRHHHLVVKWGRRFFEVDDELGLLYYFKTRAGQDWDEPARHFALAALLSVRSVDASAGPHALEIRYRATSVQAEEAEVAFGSTLKLLLRADSKADQLRWIDGLQARIRRQQPGNGLVQSGVVVDPTDRLYVATAGGGLVPRPLPAARVITPVAPAATAGTGEEELPTEVAPYSAPLQAADYGLEAAATSESAAAAGAMEATAQAHRGGRPPPPLPSTDRVLPVTQGVAAVLGSTDGAAKLSAEQLQLQMMIAMGATPVTAEGTRGSARAAAILSQHSPTDAVLDAWS